MENIITQRFQVKNVDCASCAAKIERGLKKVDGVDEASLDFANLKLHVKAKDIKRVFEAVAKIEPGVELIHENGQTTSHEPHGHIGAFNVKQELSVLITATGLFLLQLFFENWLHQLPFAGLELIIVFTAYLLAGWNVVLGAFKTIQKGTFFDENVLMVIATAGAIAIHAYSEAIGVMIFYKVGELLQDLAVSRSRRSIKALLAIRPDKAFVKTATGFIEASPESVKVGDEILVKPGEKVPLDGEIRDGQSQLDTSAITGEFKPLAVTAGDEVMAGQINKTGALTVRVTRSYTESSIAKIMDLVENAAAGKANTEKFITTFARYYTPAVVLIAASVAMIPPLVSDASFQTWIYRALVLLVISCPCALVVSIPLGYFGGIGRASRRGILVKGSNFIDALAALKTVVFDKTGTLTKGVFEVKQVVNLNGYSRDRLMEFAAAAEHHSNHPIANSILQAFAASGRQLEATQITRHREITGVGVEAQYRGHSLIVGSDNLLHLHKITHGKCDFDSTVVHVAVDDKYAGYLLIGDKVKTDAQQAVSDLRQEGIEQIVMLTGDNRYAAESVAKRLKLDRFHAELLPEQKVTVFDQIMQDRSGIGKIAFVGDGINDAPVIARADVGVAMGALGSDTAIETADVVLMTDSPSKMAEAVSIAKHTRKIVWQNISMAFVIKGIFITLGVMGLASMWEAVFADMGTALLAVANATRVLGRRSPGLSSHSPSPPHQVRDKL
jgi:Cd2+/Zn2+-exporting ATPase